METALLSGLDLTKWRQNFIRETVRDSGFEPYMGTSASDIIHVINDLDTDGYTIRVPLLKQLKGSGVSGDQRLSGNEEALNQFYQDITWDFYRHGVEISKKQREKSAVKLLEAVRPQLADWASSKIKYQIIDTFHSLNGVRYASCPEATKDAWATANADRVLFGSAVSNYSTDHSAALANVDSTNDKLTTSVATLAKRLARKARPFIRPFKTGTQGREYFVMFCHPLCFRDLKADTVMQNANRDARPREVSTNPLFQDGDLIYDGIIFREIPEFYMPLDPDESVNTATTLVNAGAGGTTTVAPNFLCGAQAIGFANKQMPVPKVKKEDDYDFFKGMGIELAHGIEKLTWNNGANTTTDPRKDVGMFTVYCSAQPDA